MKKEIWLVVILAIIIIILIGILIFIPAKKNPQTKINGIEIISPKPNENVSAPLIKITGVVNGNGWAGFEGQVGTVKLLDSDGKELATGILSATTDWTKLPTNFETTLYLPSNKPQLGTNMPQLGTLIFHNENPSGLPEKDKTFTLPIGISVPVGI